MESIEGQAGMEWETVLSWKTGGLGLKSILLRNTGERNLDWEMRTYLLDDVDGVVNHSTSAERVREAHPALPPGKIVHLFPNHLFERVEILVRAANPVEPTTYLITRMAQKVTMAV